ncbi:hypothetical protein [Chloroflexus aggregans]|nr:hypothetical protein [Chloroflexus aggregans]
MAYCNAIQIWRRNTVGMFGKKTGSTAQPCGATDGNIRRETALD